MTKAYTSNRGKKFIRDLGIYAIGNIGSKLITFILVPFYTFYISDPAEFGYYDLCLTAVFCIAPVISLQLSEAAFRYLLESDDLKQKRSIISYTYVTIARNSLILIALSAFLGFFTDIKFIAYIITYSITICLYDSTNQMVRGLGLTKAYTIANLINSFNIAIFSVLTIAVLDMGVPGLFLANIAARITSLLWMEFRTKIFSKYLSFGKTIPTIKKELLKYSIPLLPLIMSWWILNSNNVFFINHYLGLTENGIYAIISKFSSILFVIANIFYQTWQQNAIEQYHNSERDAFFTSVFNNYVYVLCSLASVFSLYLKSCFHWLVSAEYYISANYLFANSLVIVGYALSAFFEIGYQCSKQTSRLLPSIFAAAILNVGLNIVLTQFLGLYGIITSSIVTFFGLFAYRWYDTRRYMKIRIQYQSLSPIILLVLSGISFKFASSPTTSLTLALTFTAVSIIIMPRTFRDILLKRISSIKK